MTCYRIHFSFFQWVPNYSRAFLIPDLVAGLTVSTIVVPQSIAYAILADLPPTLGLYTSAIPVAVYCVMGTCPHMNVGTIISRCNHSSAPPFQLSPLFKVFITTCSSFSQSLTHRHIRSGVVDYQDYSG